MIPSPYEQLRDALRAMLPPSVYDDLVRRHLALLGQLLRRERDAR